MGRLFLLLLPGDPMGRRLLPRAGLQYVRNVVDKYD